MDIFFEILCSKAGTMLNWILPVVWCGCHALIDRRRKVLRVVVLTGLGVLILAIISLQIWWSFKTRFGV